PSRCSPAHHPSRALRCHHGPGRTRSMTCARWSWVTASHRPSGETARRSGTSRRTVSALLDVTTSRGMDTIAALRGLRATLDCFRCITISEAIMKAILSMALVLAASVLAGAADEKAADPVGKWQCSYEIGGQKRTSTLTVKKEGDKFVGTMSWSDQKDEKLK